MKYFQSLIKPEIDYILNNANFNTEQTDLFRYLTAPDYNIKYTYINICDKMHISPSKLNKLKTEIKEKINRLSKYNTNISRAD
jgi:hypothetical protein